MSDNIKYNYFIDNMLAIDVPERLGKVTSITFNYAVQPFLNELNFQVTIWPDVVDEDGMMAMSWDLKDQDGDFIDWYNDTKYDALFAIRDKFMNELWNEYCDKGYVGVDMQIAEEYSEVYNEHIITKE